MTAADLKFLKALAKNNDREWFHGHKDEYTRANQNFLNLVAAFIFGMADIDESIAGVEPASCLFRIYRDVRFSKNKAPYKTHFGAFICAAGRKSLTVPGYYLHIEPGGESILGSGLYMPDKPVLQALRNDLVSAKSRIAAALADKKMRKDFPLILDDDKAARVPRGFDKEAEHAELLKLRHFFVYAKISDKDATSPRFANMLVKKASHLQSWNAALIAASKA